MTAVEPRPISTLVSVRPRFARSVHLERDRDRSFGHGYHLTATGLELLRMVDVAFEQPTERAITVVGPYGAGKSAFCVFLAHLMEGRSEEDLDEVPEVARELLQRVRERGAGAIPVPIVGS